METDILTAVQTYLAQTGEAEKYNPEFLSLMVDTVIESYKRQRCYPDGTEDEELLLGPCHSYMCKPPLFFHAFHCIYFS